MMFGNSFTHVLNHFILYKTSNTNTNKAQEFLGEVSSGGIVVNGICGLQIPFKLEISRECLQVDLLLRQVDP